MENTTTKTNSKLKKIFSAVGTVIVYAYVAAALIFSLSVFTSMSTGHPRIMGYTVLYIETDSMEGDKEDSLFVDDLVVCKEVDTDTLEIGDIIAYDALIVNKDAYGNVIGEPYTIIKIHRIVDKSGSNFITRGDNSPDEDGDGVPDDDSPVKASDVLGKYEGFRVAKVGGFIDFISSQKGIFICLIIPMAAFFIYALYKFIKAMIEYKMSKEPVAANGELSEEQKQAAIAEYLAKQAAEANKEENNTDKKSEE